MANREAQIEALWADEFSVGIDMWEHTDMDCKILRRFSWHRRLVAR